MSYEKKNEAAWFIFNKIYMNHPEIHMNSKLTLKVIKEIIKIIY